MSKWISMDERCPPFHKLIVVHEKGHSANSYRLATMDYQNPSGVWFTENGRGCTMFSDVDYWHDVDVLEVGDE